MKAIKNEGDLLKTLFKNYSVSVRPVLNTSHSVRVTMDMTVQQLITLNEVKEKIDLRVWMRYTWIDEFLQWDPKEYGVSNIQTTADRIWVPDIVLYNSVSHRSTTPNNEETNNIPVPVSSNGAVLRMYPAILKAFCKLDVTDFPMDQQICSFKFGSWIYMVNEVDIFNKTDGSGSLDYIQHDGEWEFKGIKTKRHEIYYPCCPIPQSDVTFYLIIRRRPLSYLYNIVFPSWLVLVTSIVGCILLPTMSGEKVTLQITCLLALSVILLSLGDMMPRQSDVIARIEAFFGGCVAIMALMAVSEIGIVHIFYKGDMGQPLTDTARHICFERIAPLMGMRSYVESLRRNESGRRHLQLINHSKASFIDGAVPLETNGRRLHFSAGREVSVPLTESPLQRFLQGSQAISEGDSAADGHEKFRELPYGAIRQELQSVEAEIQQLKMKQEENLTYEMYKSEWKVFATIIGRLVGLVFLLITTLLTVVIFLRNPNYDAEVEKLSDDSR